MKFYVKSNSHLQMNSLESEIYKLRNNLYDSSIPITRAQPLLERGSYSIVHQTSSETGPWLASPSLIRMPNGTLIACYDATTRPVDVWISVSHVGGKTWEKVAIIPRMRWPNLVEVNNQVFIVGVHSSKGNGMKVSKMISLNHWSDAVSIISDVPVVHTGNVGIVIANKRLHILV